MATNGDQDTPRQGQISREDRSDFQRRSQGLGQRLDEINARRGPQKRPDQSGRGVAYGQAMRIAADLIGGIVFGVVVGWSLDQWFDTAPFLMIIFLILGFAAGLLNVIRGAREIQKQNESAQLNAPSVRDDDEEK